MALKLGGIGSKFLPFGSARWALTQDQRWRDEASCDGATTGSGDLTQWDSALADAARRLAWALSDRADTDGDGRDGFSADASDVLGMAWEIARLDDDPNAACALLFLVAAIAVSESMGGSCLELPKDGQDDVGREAFCRLLTALGATDAEANLAVQLTEPSHAKHLIGFVPDDPRQPLDTCLFRRCPVLVQSVGTRRFVFLERSLFLEAALSDEVASRLSGPSSKLGHLVSPAPVMTRPKNVSPMANEEQVRAVNAVLKALRESMSPTQTGKLTGESSSHGPGKLIIITGGPGTGKTFTVAQILRAIAADESLQSLIWDNAIRFTAPTGKAADRMEESIRKSLGSDAESGESGVDAQQLTKWLAQEVIRPKTIHRLLKSNPGTGRFEFNRYFPLDARLVISDEASMIGLELMEQLMTSVRPDAVFVLLGDENQLPSVESGAVLRELCGLSHVTDQIVRLVVSKRQSADAGGVAIGEASKSIHLGQLPAPSAMVRHSSVGQVSFEGVELVPLEDGRLQQLCDRWFQRFTQAFRTDMPAYLALTAQVFDVSSGSFSPSDLDKLNAIFDCALSQKVLSLTRAQKDELNEAFHRRQTSGLEALHTGFLGTPSSRSNRQITGAFAQGEPVMVLHNDPQRGVFNGDQGVVLKLKTQRSSPPRLHVVFQKSHAFSFFPLSELRDQLELAFAMTIHKSQGSEYERVLLVLPNDSHSPLLCRELIYTAVTRAKKSVVISGDEVVLSTALQRTASERRMSSLAHRVLRLMSATGEESRPQKG